MSKELRDVVGEELTQAPAGAGEQRLEGVFGNLHRGCNVALGEFLEMKQADGDPLALRQSGQGCFDPPGAIRRLQVIQLICRHLLLGHLIRDVEALGFTQPINRQVRCDAPQPGAQSVRWHR